MGWDSKVWSSESKAYPLLHGVRSSPPLRLALREDQQKSGVHSQTAERVSDLRLWQGKPIGTVIWLKCWNDLNEGRLEKNLEYWVRTGTASGPQLDHTHAT